MIPLPVEALDASLRPFGQSRMLPRGAYVDDDVFAWEDRHFLRGGWMCLGRSEDIAEPGDQRAEWAGRAGVLLVRGSDGVVRGFANACRHRGHELLPGGEGRNRPIVVCPYHSWSYRLDGTLRGAPGFEALDGFDAADFGLMALPTEEWHGLLFVDASGVAGPFADHVRGLEAFVAPYEPERLRTAGRHDYVVAANWKILSENYQECYHCSMIHPELCRVSPPNSGENYSSSAGGAWVGGWMGLVETAHTMSLDGTLVGSPLRRLDADGRRQVIYIVLFPNVLLSLHPDYVMTHVLTPLASDRTRVRCGWAFSPEDLGRAGFDPSPAIDFWDITNRQDWAACESVQRGLVSTDHIAGPLSPREDGVYRYVTMVARGYRGLPLGTDRVDPTTGALQVARQHEKTIDPQEAPAVAHEVRGVVARAKGAPVTLETVLVPDPGPGEALVKVQACGVCHTDLHYREGGINDDFPFLLGHEAAGIVEAVGPEVTSVTPGDFVVLNWRAVCGQCRACRRGRPWYCFSTHNATQPMTLSDGTKLAPALGIGAFAEKTLVAAGQCTKVDRRARPEAVGLLGCGVMAGLGAAMFTGGVTQGDTVAVFGCGGVGCAAIAGARLAGAAKVIAVDLDPRKLELATEFGATDTVAAADVDPVEAIRALTGGFGADICIEAVGNAKVMQQAFDARDLAGTLVQVGVPTPDMRIDMPMIDFFGHGGSLKPSWYGDCLPSRDFPMLVDLYLQGRLDLDRFVSETIPLDGVEEAFHRMERGEVLRSVVVLGA